MVQEAKNGTGVGRESLQDQEGVWLLFRLRTSSAGLLTRRDVE